jgi:arsenate reductase
MKDEENSLRVLFVSSGNWTRTQMAETILRRLTRGRVHVASAGSEPRKEIHPMTREVIKKVIGVEMANQRPKHVQEFRDQTFDFVFLLAEGEVVPTDLLPLGTEPIRWTFEDPSKVEGTDAEKRRAFESVARGLMGRIRIWLALPQVAEKSGLLSVAHPDQPGLQGQRVPANPSTLGL